MTKEDIRRLKEAANKMFKWESSGKAFGHFEFIENKKSDRLYEFYCLARILNDLSVNHDITLELGRNDKAIFPQSPAKKKGWAYFKVVSKDDKSKSFQVCFGTEIKLSKTPKTSVAPDISVQAQNSSEDPDESMVDMILDAKYKNDSSKLLDIGTIREFCTCVEDLKVADASKTELYFDQLKDLKANCLLTNGKGLDKHHDYCVKKRVKQIGRFDLNNNDYEVIG